MNKPYCWLLNGEVWFKEPKETDKEFDGYEITPLYTNPVKELPPCEELREFQEQQNGVFSEHNACCYRHECRIVWNDWEKLRSEPVKELTDEEIADFLWAYCLDMGDVYEASEAKLIECVKAILRKAQEK